MGWSPLRFSALASLSQYFGQAGIDFGDFQAQGRIDEYRRALFTLQFRKHLLVAGVGKDAVHFIDQFLGAPQGKGRDEHLAVVGQCPGKDVAQLPDALVPGFVQPVAVGGFHDHQIGRVRCFGIDQDGRVRCTQISGKSTDAPLLWSWKRMKLEPRMCPARPNLERDAFFQVEGLAIFKSPRQVVDGPCDPADKPARESGKFHGIGQHGVKQGLGGVGTDDFALKALLDQFRHPADVIDVGMGEKQVVDFGRRYGPVADSRARFAALGQAAVHHDGSGRWPAAGGRSR
jgi:hypothetical protein